MTRPGKIFDWSSTLKKRNDELVTLDGKIKQFRDPFNDNSGVGDLIYEKFKVFNQVDPYKSLNWKKFQRYALMYVDDNSLYQQFVPENCHPITDSTKYNGMPI